jgi:YidC/Oxa1 family membrane protein insertase
MKLWSENKVHPLSSCLPLLIQFPILIALFYTINGGLSPDRSFLIYDFLPQFNLNDINPNFLGLNLFTRNLILLPIIVGGLQFAQMQLINPGGSKKDAKPNMPEEMVAANNMMKYMMPIMIALFTAQLPSAVGLYWGTSTFYGVLQQLVVNKEGPRAKDSSDGEVKVRVIQKNHGK